MVVVLSGLSRVAARKPYDWCLRSFFCCRHQEQIRGSDRGPDFERQRETLLSTRRGGRKPLQDCSSYFSFLDEQTCQSAPRAELTPACEIAVGFLSRHYDEASCSRSKLTPRLSQRFARVPAKCIRMYANLRESPVALGLFCFDKFGYNFSRPPCPRLSRR